MKIDVRGYENSYQADLVVLLLVLYIVIKMEHYWLEIAKRNAKLSTDIQ